MNKPRLSGCAVFYGCGLFFLYCLVVVTCTQTQSVTIARQFFSANGFPAKVRFEQVFSKMPISADLSEIFFSRIACNGRFLFEPYQSILFFKFIYDVTISMILYD